MNPSIFAGVCLLAFMATTLTASVLHVPVSHIKLPEHLAEHLQKQHPHQSPTTIAYKKHLADLAKPPHMSKHPRAQIRDQPMSTQATPTVSDPIPVDQTYYVVVGNITAGTPPQQFTVAIDLSQEDLYLIGVGADGTSGESSSSKNQYDKSASTTYQNPNGSFSADSGGVSGSLVNDIVNLGGLNVNLTFGDVDYVDWWVNFLPIDGVLGISPQNSSNNMQNVQNQLAPQMAEPVLVMHMNNDTRDSFIAFGSEDVPQCQQPWAHVSNGILDGYGLSNMNVTSLSIEGTTTSLAMSNRPLVVSNWLDTKFVSNQTRDLLIQASGATRNNQTRQYELPCASMAQAKNVVMTLSVGVTITLTPNDYMLVRVDPNDGTSTCTLDVVGWYDENEPNYRSYELELDQRFLKTRCVSYNSQTKVLGLTPLASTAQSQPNTGPTPDPWRHLPNPKTQ